MVCLMPLMEILLPEMLTAEIISDIIETGDISLNQWVEQGTGNYTLTIKPNSAVSENFIRLVFWWFV